VALLEMIGAADAGFIFPSKENIRKHRKAPIQTYVPDAAIISQLKIGLP
jgi:hypothetical protein